MQTPAAVPTGGKRSLEDELKEVHRLFDVDKLFQAGRKLDKLEKELSSLHQAPNVSPELKAQAEIVARDLATDVRIQIIRQRSEECRLLLEDCKDSPRWECTYDGKSTKVWYRKEEETVSHSVKTEGLLHCEFIKLASLIYETDLYNKFWWFVREMKDIKKVSRCCKSVHGHYQLIWPMSDREVPILGYAVDGLDEDNCVVLFFRELYETDKDLEGNQIPIPPKIPKAVRINMTIAGMKFVPVGRNATRMTMVCNIDPKISHIAPPLINWATRSVFRFSLRILEVKANELDAMPHKDRMQTDPFYIWLEGRVEDYLKSTGLDKKERTSEPGRTSFEQSEATKGPSKPPKLGWFG